jgi:hypothetical protein
MIQAPDGLPSVVQVLLGGGGVVTLAFAAAHLSARRRAHLLEVYRHTFDLLDDPTVRDARHYVYEIQRDAFETEHWMDLENFKIDPQYNGWKENKGKAERVARTFDQLGLLLREGRIPTNIIARFYASPILRCWYQLSPYIGAVRARRNQPGHMWEWENLVFEIVAVRLKKNKGTWKGARNHDNLESQIQAVEHERDVIRRDKEYKPGIHLWEIGRSWLQFWKW